jgi:hypothetical protein
MSKAARMWLALTAIVILGSFAAPWRMTCAAFWRFWSWGFWLLWTGLVSSVLLEWRILAATSDSPLA